MYNILICDDEKDIVSAIKIYLSSGEYKTFCAYNGSEALDIISKNEIHLVLLDMMMPKMDGIETITKIREGSNVPVIMITAKSEDTDIIQGLNSGADDYITKPFNPIELLARVRSQLRRYTQLGSMHLHSDVIEVGGLLLDNSEKSVTSDGENIILTKTEYDILKLFMENPGVVMSPKEIYEKIWKLSSFGGENTVAVHIRHLREKLEINPSAPRYIKVVWGQGYKLERGKT